MNGYDLTRQWWDFAFENRDRVKPIHSALYFYAIDQCNRMGWAEKFGLPAYMAMGAIGVSHHNTYSKAFEDLVEWGFFKLIQKAKNQHTANIIALSKIDTALYTALDKATVKHLAEQAQEQGDGTITINKQQTINNKPQTTKERPTLEEVEIYCDERGFQKQLALNFYNGMTANGWKVGKNPCKDWKAAFRTWEGKEWNAQYKKQTTTTSRPVVDLNTKLY